jgi:hypothetical protein
MCSTRLSLPPRIKILEALGALADGRVKEEGENFFSVVSSDGSRTYRVYVEKVGQREFRACSTDNGTVYRGYVGYPIISAMMLLGHLERNLEVEKALSGIPWRKLNETLKKYALVENEIMKTVSSRGVSPKSVYAVVSKVMSELGKLVITLDEKVCGADVAKEEGVD